MPPKESGTLSDRVRGRDHHATGAAIDASIGFALADRADSVEPAEVQALQALSGKATLLPGRARFERVLLLGAGSRSCATGAATVARMGRDRARRIGDDPDRSVGRVRGDAVLILVVSVLLTQAHAEPPPTGSPPTERAPWRKRYG